MIANSAGLSERYVSQIMHCGFLAPSDLIEAILQGRYAPRLTLRNLAKHLPLDWSEQRRVFGVVVAAGGQCWMSLIIDVPHVRESLRVRQLSRYYGLEVKLAFSNPEPRTGITARRQTVPATASRRNAAKSLRQPVTWFG